MSPHLRGDRRGRGQRGLTLIELMVAMVIGLVISIAAVAALVVARAGFTAVDATAQLRENAHFASDLLQRIVMQAGYENWADDTFVKELQANFNGNPPTPEPDVVGFNNAVFPASPNFPLAIENDSRDSACAAADSSCVNGSDVLVVRYQGMDRTPGKPDGSIINCAGIPEGAPAASTDDRAWSVFHVARSTQSGEPVLMCSYRDTKANTWVTRPLIQGVESFQVLYGTDSVTINTDPETQAAKDQAGAPDSVPDRYLQASQIVVPGNAEATKANWRRVRSVRIGLLLRGPVGSKPRSGDVKPFSPFGIDADLSSTADKGTLLNIPEDGRLRMTTTFTIYLHNRLAIKDED